MGGWPRIHAINDNKSVAVVLLDLSAAFDTVIGHQILLNRLRHTFGIQGKVFAWIYSYLRVCIDNSSSSSCQALRYGMLQGSVVGPLFFILYICCIGAIIRKYKIHHHMYADNVQLYLNFNLKVEGAGHATVVQLSKCIAEVSDMVRMNKLKLNQRNTEFFIACSRYNPVFI